MIVDKQAEPKHWLFMCEWIANVTIIALLCIYIKPNVLICSNQVVQNTEAPWKHQSQQIKILLQPTNVTTITHHNTTQS